MAGDAGSPFRIVLLNPSNITSGFALMTPRWMPIIAGATPAEYSDDILLIDQSVQSVNYSEFKSTDLVAISVHTLNYYRSAQLIKELVERVGCTVVAGGVHTTLYPEDLLQCGAASVITGDGDLVWRDLVADFATNSLKRRYTGGRIAGNEFVATPRWDLLDHTKYVMATVHSTRGCPEACTFCSVWRTDGRQMRVRAIEHIVEEVNVLYGLGFRLILLADDNFYAMGEHNSRLHNAIMTERYELMSALERNTPEDIAIFSQTTIRTADDEKFLDAMYRAKIRGVLVGIEAVDESGLNAINKKFNKISHDISDAVVRMQRRGVNVLGSYIVGLPTDKPHVYDLMLDIATKSNMWLAQFVRYIYFPGTVDFERLKRNKLGLSVSSKDMLEYWRHPLGSTQTFEHPHMTQEELNRYLTRLWSEFYSAKNILTRGWSLGYRNPIKLVSYYVISKVYKTIYHDYGMAADSVKTVNADYLTSIVGFVALKLYKRKPVYKKPTLLTKNTKQKITTHWDAVDGYFSRR